MQFTNLSCAASRELDDELALLELAAALLPDDPQADKPTAMEPARAHVIKARRARVDTDRQAYCIRGDS
jgi:hypothetical protein